MDLTELIKIEFSDLVEKFDLEADITKPSKVVYSNKYCCLEVMVEKGIEVYITFINRKDGQRYGLSGLIAFNKLDDKLEEIDSQRWMDFYSNLIKRFFFNLLEGDFSWVDEYNKFIFRNKN